MSPLSRRALLRGAIGSSIVSVALPALDAMLDSHGTAFADGRPFPVRFMTWYWADGVTLDRFEPATVGANWQPSEELEPLSPHKSYISVCTGLANPSQVAIGHHEGMTVFSGHDIVPLGGLSSNAGGPTIDQVIADLIAADTPIRDVHVQVSKRVSTDGDGGTTAIALSHRGLPGNLIPNVPQVEPKLVWQSLFGSFLDAADMDAPRARVLAAVREDAKRLQQKVGIADRQRLEAHLTAVDELEKKILATAPECTLVPSPVIENTDQDGLEPLHQVNAAMADLIAYAFACDITRVASFMFKRFVSATVLGGGEIHHNTSHQVDSPLYNNGIRYMMEKFADLLASLGAVQEIDGGTLLDSTVVYASTDVSTGYSHSIDRQPVLLAGHGRGALVHPGIHYQSVPFNGDATSPNASGSTSDVLLTCLQCFDPAAEVVGGGATASTTPIAALLA